MYHRPNKLGAIGLIAKALRGCGFGIKKTAPQHQKRGCGFIFF